MKKQTILFFWCCLVGLNACSVLKSAKNKGEPKIVDFYFMDKDGNRISEVANTEDFVYMVVHTENILGKEISITLREKDDDTAFHYIHKNKLVGDTLHFKIRSNEEKVKLEFLNTDKKRHRRLLEKAERNNK